jgi:hypothetical protein
VCRTQGGDQNLLRLASRRTGLSAVPFWGENQGPGEVGLPDIPAYRRTTGPCSGELDHLVRQGPGLREAPLRECRGLGDFQNFYNQRFQMNLTDQQKADLVAFLNSL